MHVKIIVAAMLRMHSFLPAAAIACTPRHGRWYLNVNLTSIHTEKRARERLNQRNPGFGLTYRWSGMWVLTGGMYQNSYRRPT